MHQYPSTWSWSSGAELFCMYRGQITLLTIHGIIYNNYWVFTLNIHAGLFSSQKQFDRVSKFHQKKNPYFYKECCKLFSCHTMQVIFSYTFWNAFQKCHSAPHHTLSRRRTDPCKRKLFVVRQCENSTYYSKTTCLAARHPGGMQDLLEKNSVTCWVVGHSH